MSAFKQQWAKLASRFDAYSQREKALLAVVAVGGIVMLGFTALIDPNLAKVRTAERLVAQQQNDASNVEALLQSVKVQLKLDPDAGRKAALEKLKAELLAVENAVRNLEGGLVAPEKMNTVLERLLAGNSRLRLLSLKSLAPVNIADAGKAEGAKSPIGGLGLYKHGVEVRLEGSYADLHAWLSQMESTEQKILWGDVRLQVVEHPRSVLSLTIFTLGTDKAWLAI